MITVSSCGVKLQEVLSGLEKERLKHWRYMCTFVAFLNYTILFFFLSTWGVIFLDECQLQSTFIIYFEGVCVQLENGGVGSKEKE